MDYGEWNELMNPEDDDNVSVFEGIGLSVSKGGEVALVVLDGEGTAFITEVGYDQLRALGAMIDAVGD